MGRGRGAGGEIRGFLTGLALTAALIVVLASAPPYLPGQALLQSLRFHLAGATLLLAVTLLVSRARWRGVALAGLVALSLAEGGWIVLTQQQARQQIAERPGAVSFEIVSFNVLIRNPNGAEIAGMLIARAPDVAVLMEAAPLFSEFGRLEALFPFRAGCETEAVCDTLLLSRTPLEDVAIESLSPFSPDRAIIAATTIGGERVNLVAVHLTKPYFDFGSEIEARRLVGHLARLEGPVVVAGDFNAAPWSGNIRRMMRDAGLLAGNAYVATWPVPFGPLGVPIDGVFTRAPAVIEAVEALPDALGSNHRGLWARVRLVD